MELDHQLNQEKSILSYDDDSITTENGVYNFPCFISVDEVINFDNFSLDDNKSLQLLRKLNKNTEVLIIGTKAPYPIKSQFAIKELINSEFMNITSSIYSFNLMLGDNRRAALLIL